MIEGIVRTASGQPLAGATVVLDPQLGGEYVMRRTVTNDHGEFSLDRVLSGEYAIYALKEQDGFGDVGAKFFGLGKPPLQRITVDDGPKAVSINIGEPGGQLQILVLDQGGKPLRSAVYKLSAADDPSAFIQFGGRLNGVLSTPVPPLPFVIEVTAQGYEAWRSQRMLIRSRDVEDVRVRLVRSLESSKH
jgi:hypothetical protein